jgi:hypothetical protein
LLDAQGFPALQPPPEAFFEHVAQPGCASFPCISCTNADALPHQLLQPFRCEPDGADFSTSMFLNIMLVDECTVFVHMSGYLVDHQTKNGARSM